MEKIELVRVKRFLYCIDDYVHFVIGVEFGNLVAGSDSSTVALLQITRTPRCVGMMNCDTPFLGVDSGTKH